MSKRLILFFIIVFVVLSLYNHFILKPYIEKQKELSLIKKAEIIKNKPKGIKKQKKEQQEEIPKNEISEKEEREISFYTDVFRVSFINKGGVINSIKLLNYLDDNKEPLEMVPRLDNIKTYPFTVKFDDLRTTLIENTALYKVQVSNREENKQKIKVIEFVFSDGKGNYFKKTFYFGKGYLIRFKGKFISNNHIEHPFIYWGPGIQSLTLKQKKEYGWGYKEATGIIWKNNSKNSIHIKEVKKGEVKIENIKWSGIHNNFFLAAFIPLSDNNISKFELPEFYTEAEVKDNLIMDGIREVDAEEVNLNFYLGPKDPEIIKEVGFELTEAIDYGFFGFLAKMLLAALKFLYQYVKNYGLAIIILTIFIRIIFYPLTFKGMKSMEKMKEIQPQMQAIREKYKKIPFNDPRKQKMNQEIMELYRRHGINPTSGCLPLLLQLPVLWGFYSLLSVSIELRSQPFILWIKDLSRPDPYYITPILMGITMIWQQKLSPTTADPMQQRLMMLMPIFFTFLFINAQSGLVLYWLFNNIFSIIQQKYLTSANNKPGGTSTKKNK